MPDIFLLIVIFILLTLVLASIMSEPNKPKYCGVHSKRTKIPKWGAQITVEGVRYQLGSWRSPEEAALAYDCMAVQHLGAKARLNFEEYRAVAHLRAPESMRLSTRAEEKEHRQAERQLARRRHEEDDPMVRALREDPEVMALQRQFFGEVSSIASLCQEDGLSTRSDGVSSSSAPQLPPGLTPGDYGFNENWEPLSSPVHSSDFDFTSSDSDFDFE